MTAPVHAPRRRLDETLAARKPVLSYRKPSPNAAGQPTLHEKGDR
jgi:glycine dehydrogenase subunit 2